MASKPRVKGVVIPGAVRKGKYNASGRRVNGVWCASEAEAKRYEQLLLLQHAGEIANLEAQPKFPVRVNNVLITTYRADFRYDVVDDRGQVFRNIVEDVKGLILDIYVLKKKLVEAAYNIRIQEIPASDVPSWFGRIP